MRYLAIILTIALTYPSFALQGQSIPTTLTFSMYKAKLTIDRSIQEPPVKKVCMQVFKVGNQVNFYFCNTQQAERSFTIDQVQKETRDQEMYIMQYFGYEYYKSSAVPSFLSFAYDYASGQWSVLLENVNDNDIVPLFRHLSIYYNPY
jgi:hypothetical protein